MKKRLLKLKLETYTINKTEGFDNMRGLLPDKSFRSHNVTLSVYSQERSNFTYFIMCRRACDPPSYLENAVEISLRKAAKPDETGPRIIDKLPEAIRSHSD